ncbi:hypothetical protein OAF27_02085 [Verrucomicrobiales bacterium]|nr:hypothetical protein [Verrucomicrobiales bacterium]
MSPDLTQQKTPAEADAARATLLEAIEQARKALEALPDKSPDTVAIDEAPIAPPENIEISPAVSTSEPEPAVSLSEEPAKESKTEDTPVTATLEAPEERASREDDAYHPDPVEIHYWRRAQIEAMNEDLASAFEKERGNKASSETVPFAVAPLTFSQPPFPTSDAEDDGTTSQELPLGGSDGSQVVLPS